MEIPGPDGRPQSFRVERTQRMESELAAAHSEIATWSVTIIFPFGKCSSASSCCQISSHSEQ